MSYIQCVVTTQSVFMASDGRAMAEGRICSEDYKKVRRIGDTVLVGYAGHQIFCECVLNLAEQNLSAEQNVDTVFDVINKVSKIVIAQSGVLCKGQFMVAGQCANDKMGLRTFSTNNGFSSTSLIPKNDNELLYSEAFSEKIGAELLGEELKKIMKDKNGCMCANDLVGAMQNAATKASRIDESVNNKFFFETLYRNIKKRDEFI